MKPVSRSDFISDASSSDDETLPELSSLRERLAKKRKLIVGSVSSLGGTFSVASGGHEDTGIIDLSEDNPVIPRREGASVMSAAVDGNRISPVETMCTKKFSNGSDDIEENLPLSQQEPDCEMTLQKPKIDTGINFKELKEDMPHDSKLEVKGKKKRTLEEIETSRRKAQEKREERERQKQAKEAEKQIKKAERETKRQFSLGSCLKYVKVLVDTHVVNTCGLGVVFFKACEELGVPCETRELPLPFTIMWKRLVTECSMSADNKVETLQNEQDEQEVLAIIPMSDFIIMVNAFKQSQRGEEIDGVTLRDYVQRILNCLPEKLITVIVPGLEQYFKDIKSKNNRQYREAVQATNPGSSGRTSRCKSGLVTVSRVDVEEAVTDILLQTGCSTFLLDTPEDVADTVRKFTKAVAERPAKQDRFDPIFSFHEEGVGGVKVDKNGVGLLKVWKQQLLQFKNVSPDVGQAIIAEYPSPLLLKQAYEKCSSEKEALKLLENIVVRRGAGVLETTRRVGKELSRRIYTFFTSCDPGLIIK